jgi:hypothetical protein
VGIIFRLLGGGPDYRFNGVPAMVYMKDRAAWARSVLAAMEKAQPTAVLPGHGAPLKRNDGPAARTKEILSAL